MKQLLMIIMMVFFSTAQTINISGKIVDRDGAAIEGALLKLKKAGKKTLSDKDGKFVFTDNSTDIVTNKYKVKKIDLKVDSRTLLLKVEKTTSVNVKVFNIWGQRLFSIKRILNAGLHTFPLQGNSSGLYIYKVKTGEGELLLRGTVFGNKSAIKSIEDNAVNSSFLKKYARLNRVDTLYATKENYLNYEMNILRYDTSDFEVKLIECAGTVTDIDGNIYQSVKIGNQIWATENLKTTTLNDGTPIVKDPTFWAKSSTEPRYCYFGDLPDSLKIILHLNIPLYNLYAVNTGKLAPLGWHVASTAEWDTLENYLIAHNFDCDGKPNGNKIARAMSNKISWERADSPIDNASGFNARISGWANFNGFRYFKDAMWWTSTSPNSYMGNTTSLLWLDDTLLFSGMPGSAAAAVRIVRD